MSNKYYVYVYMDPRIKGEYKYLGVTLSFKPFYIGKGSKKRIYDHLTIFSKNCLKSNLIKELQQSGLTPIIQQLYQDLSEEEAFYLETLWIKHFEIISNGGILLNKKYGTSVTKLEIKTKVNDLLLVENLNPKYLYTQLNVKYVTIDVKSFKIVKAYFSSESIKEDLNITDLVLNSRLKADFPYNMVKGVYIIERSKIPEYYLEDTLKSRFIKSVEEL